MKLSLLFGQHLIIVIGKYYLFLNLVILNSWINVFIISCGNIAAILELNETLQRGFIIFEAAVQVRREMPTKKHTADYFL